MSPRFSQQQLLNGLRLPQGCAPVALGKVLAGLLPGQQAGCVGNQRNCSADAVRQVRHPLRGTGGLGLLCRLGKVEGVWAHQHRTAAGSRFDQVLPA